jgi:CO dehydrogenase maturation factor
MIRVVVVGRGGTGKTTLVALAARWLCDHGAGPVLLVDADPDQSLAEMVGADLAGRGVRTIAELLEDTFIEGGGTTSGVAPSERIEGRIWKEGLYEGECFDLIALGTKWIEGCYCLPDAALKRALGQFIRQYRFLLIDSPAGLEHLNRRIAEEVDLIIDLVGASKKSFDHVTRARRVADESGVRYSQFIVAGGYQIEAESEARAAGAGGTYIGRIEHDPTVAEYTLEGRSLFDLPPDNPGLASVGALLSRSGIDV